jgi:hypothetical protein
VPMQIMAEPPIALPAPSPSKAVAPADSSRIEITLPDGTCVRVGSGVGLVALGCSLGYQPRDGRADARHALQQHLFLLAPDRQAVHAVADLAPKAGAATSAHSSTLATPLRRATG